MTNLKRLWLTPTGVFTSSAWLDLGDWLIVDCSKPVCGVLCMSTENYYGLKWTHSALWKYCTIDCCLSADIMYCTETFWPEVRLGQQSNYQLFMFFDGVQSPFTSLLIDTCATGVYFVLWSRNTLFSYHFLKYLYYLLTGLKVYWLFEGCQFHYMNSSSPNK